MLLQISEPDNLPSKPAHKLVAGIDLGTTHSLVATVHHGMPTILLDEKGYALLPSVVRYTEQGVAVGQEALAAQTKDPSNTIVSVKRFMGRALTDLGDTRQFPYQWLETSGMGRLKTRAGEKNPVEISAAPSSLGTCST